MLNLTLNKEINYVFYEFCYNFFKKMLNMNSLMRMISDFGGYFRVGSSINLSHYFCLDFVFRMKN
jgi:hypothetical protein